MKINKWITGLTAFGVFATTALAGKAPSTTANPSNTKEKQAAKDKVVTSEDPDTHKNNQGKGHFKAKGKGHHKDVSEVE